MGYIFKYCHLISCSSIVVVTLKIFSQISNGTLNTTRILKKVSLQCIRIKLIILEYIKQNVQQRKWKLFYIVNKNERMTKKNRKSAAEEKCCMNLNDKQFLMQTEARPITIYYVLIRKCRGLLVKTVLRKSKVLIFLVSFLLSRFLMKQV